MTRRRPAALAACALLATLCAASPAVSQSETDESIGQIVRDRMAIAHQLVRPIARCVRRHDTGHASFHGCIDWHSAVHGTLGLVIFGNITGERQYDGLIEEQVATPKIERERQLLRADPGFEMPYGRAWFLRLATEYERRFASDRLRAMASEVAGSLQAFIAPRRSDLLEGAYDSLSWALINLLDYAQAAGDRNGARFATEYARDALLRAGPRCNYRLESSEFMSVCLQRAWLASKVLSAAEFENWHRDFIAAVGLPDTVSQPTSAHHYGLNFSRSWALASLYRKTGQSAYGTAFASHFSAGYKPRENWDGGYRTVAHWVAQFGMMALLLLGDGTPQSPAAR